MRNHRARPFREHVVATDNEFLRTVSGRSPCVRRSTFCPSHRETRRKIRPPPPGRCSPGRTVPSSRGLARVPSGRCGVKQSQKQVDMALSPSLGDAGRQGSHFVSGGGQKVAVVSRHTRACPLVPPTLSSPASLRSFVSRLSDGGDVIPLFRHRPRFSSSIPLRRCSPTWKPRLPHLEGLDHLPFYTRRTLWPPSSRQK